MIAPPEKTPRPGWFKFRIAQALGPGEHRVEVVTPGPPVLVVVNGLDYDERDRPNADIQAYHPDLDGISWPDIWEAVRSQNPSASPRPQAGEGEYRAVKDSIATFGALQRVIEDEAGNVIAGRLRRRACAELGVHCPTEVISGLTADQKEQLSFELDFCRKHLSLADKRRAAEFMLQATPRNTDRVIGRACGLDHKTVGGIRGAMEERGEIPQVEERRAGDGKLYKFPKVVADTRRELERARNGLLALGEDAPAKPLGLRRAEELVRRKKALERKAFRAQTPVLPDDSIQIVHSDFRELRIEDDSARLFLPDPPYDRQSLPLYEEVARFAARKLRPGGILLAYHGVMYMPEILAMMTRHLNFVWQMSIVFEAGNRYVQDRNILSQYRPVLVFSKGPPRMPVALPDVLHGGGCQKDIHPWQQSIEEEMFLIERLTNPGELVVSPFGGGFTTAAACYRLGRRCLSCDIDAEAVQNGLVRLAKEREQGENNK